MATKVAAPPYISEGSPDAARAALIRKAQLDPIYGPAYAIHGSVEMLLEGGFFDDMGAEGAAALRAGDDWLMTPTFKITGRLRALGELADHQRLIVLVCTGSFCPIHEGHIEQLNIAKQSLEAQGHIVLGGYVSPSHDMYVSQKCGADTLSAIHRLRLCEEACAESDWLMADGWEALGTERALNFSDVIVRLERYLARHLRSPRPIEVAYVFGSDHARFSRAFIGAGTCVCTFRPGYEEPFNRYASEPGIRNNPRILFAGGQERVMSSKAVREGSDHLMAERARSVYRRWLDATKAPVLRRAQYLIRYEDDWPVRQWCEYRQRADLLSNWETFCHLLMNLLRQTHAAAEGPDPRYEPSFRVGYLPAQMQLAKSIASLGPVISMDPCVPGTINLGVCRRFPHSASCIKPKISGRPGMPPLPEQVSAIPGGDWNLMDDDISTGRTLTSVLGMLPSDVHIKRFFTLSGRSFDDPVPLLDILDCRDFLAGGRQSGLVVELPNGELGRAPYCLPYVSPSDRASTPLSQEFNFSREIWKLNAWLFGNVEDSILLAETDPNFQRMMNFVGFANDTSMTAICQWHEQYLARLIDESARARSESRAS